MIKYIEAAWLEICGITVPCPGLNTYPHHGLQRGYTYPDLVCTVEGCDGTGRRPLLPTLRQKCRGQFRPAGIAGDPGDTVRVHETCCDGRGWLPKPDALALGNVLGAMDWGVIVHSVLSNDLEASQGRWAALIGPYSGIPSVKHGEDIETALVLAARDALVAVYGRAGGV